MYLLVHKMYFLAIAEQHFSYGFQHLRFDDVQDTQPIAE